MYITTPMSISMSRRLPAHAYLYDNPDDEQTPTEGTLTRTIKHSNVFYRLATSIKYALMAFRSNYIVCYFCNVKSSTKFHSGITSFVCPCCDAENFLDENGDITDPPVSLVSDNNGSANLRRRPLTVPRLDFEIEAPSTNTFSFCKQCSNEQRLKVAAIAGFEGTSEAAREEFVRNTELRYPGICEKCRPGANEALKLSYKTAKQDFFGQVLRKSRAEKLNRQHTTITASIGRLIWITAIIARILLSICSIVIAAPPRILNNTINTAVDMVATDSIVCLILTLSSAFWNPKYNGSQPLTSHLTRYTKWYFFQILTCAINAITLLYVNPLVFGLNIAVVTMSFHVSLIIFYVLIAKMALDSIESATRKTPNWRNIPLIDPTVPRPQPKGPDTMFSALIDIAAGPSVNQNSLEDSSMDWTPTVPKTPTAPAPRKIAADFQLAPPRFFAPQPQEKDVDDVVALFEKNLSVSSTDHRYKRFTVTKFVLISTATLIFCIGVWFSL
ncbi:hypothetical protein HYALB_00001106 [Hymenoscyphus albidus]|uniref:Ima1 N-terminal domain-containing protein n=1 Tax=Hymenoscyphus albidus TaxID=595503 RepID=A0A9N9PRG8_9HELO|nr:hypothetical protein HYALB_00001106 [Hymenoscyphus albidus]